MGDYVYNQVVDRWNATGVGTNAGVSVTKAAVTGKRYAVTGIQCSGDAAAVVTIESPSGTKLYQKRFAAAFNYSEKFDTGMFDVGAANQAVLVKISASTSNCEANIQGVSINDKSA